LKCTTFFPINPFLLLSTRAFSAVGPLTACYLPERSGIEADAVAIIVGLLLDSYYGVDLGLPVIDGTMISFFVSDGLGLLTVSLVMLFVT